MRYPLPSLNRPVSDRLTKFYGPSRIFYVSSILDFMIARTGESGEEHGRIKQQAGFLYYLTEYHAPEDDFAERSDRAVTIGGIMLRSRGGGQILFRACDADYVRRIWLDVGEEPVKPVGCISLFLSFHVITRNNFAPVRCNQLINCARRYKFYRYFGWTELTGV